MPGIVGLITTAPREYAQSALSAMMKKMHHDGSWVCGTMINETLGLYVGWTARASSPAARMPLQDARNQVSMIFAGEEFTGECPSGSMQASSSTCGEYLLDIYRDDCAFPSTMNGRFHGVVCDGASKRVVLFNDRFGLQRIYYYQDQESFYFAAEAKSILEVVPETRALDPRGLGEYLSCGCVLENRSLFRDIKVLPPASAWVFADRKLTSSKTYFEPRQWQEQEPLDPERYYEQLRETFVRILPRYFKGNQKTGISLTGGLDTRMIMAWHKAAPSSLPCYSFGSSYRNTQDVILARRVALACGQTHEVITVGDNFLRSFPSYASQSVYLTDAAVDVSHAADLYVNEKAAQIASVRMTGNYGGEVLRRVRAFKPEFPLAGLFDSAIEKQIRSAHVTYDQAVAVHPLSFAVFRQAPWHHYGLLHLEQTQLTLRSPFLDNDLLRVVFRAPSSATTNDRISLRLIAEGNTALAQIRTDRGYLYNSSGVSAAAVRGLLSFIIKAEYAYDYGMPQWVAGVDHALHGLHLEKLFLGRNKFYHYRVWYRDTLADYVRSVLLDSTSLSRDYLNRKKTEEVVLSHTSGRRNYTSEIHKLLTLELAQRTLLS